MLKGIFALGFRRKLNDNNDAFANAMVTKELTERLLLLNILLEKISKL